MPKISSYPTDTSIDGTEKMISSGSGVTKTISTGTLTNYIRNDAPGFTFQAFPNTGATTGTINIDWSASQNYKQLAPTGNITYTFTNPTGPCRPLLIINPPAAGTVTFSLPVTWMDSLWTQTAGKKAIISLIFDGSVWYAAGVNEV